MGLGDIVVPPGITFVCSGVSGIGAAVAAQPMDLVKNRMQMTGGLHHYKSSFHCARLILRNEGFAGFYSGLSASLARQLTYTTARLSIYNVLLEKNKECDFFRKMIMASIAGSIGAFVGNPADVALVRMSIDSSIPADQRKNYKHVFDVWYRMAKEDGVASLWKGSLPTIYRAVIVNVSQLATFTQSKELIVSQSINLGYPIENKYYIFTIAALISGFITSVCSLPMDLAKTRLQQQSCHYNGMISCLYNTARLEGVKKLWSGFGAYYARTGPRTLVTLLIMDTLLYKYKLMKYKKQILKSP